MPRTINASFPVFLAISFLIGAPAFYFSNLASSVGIQVLLFLAGSYGVALAAWGTLRIFRLHDESVAFVRRLRIVRSHFTIYLIGIGLPSAIWLITAAILASRGAAEGFTWINLASLPLILLTNYGEEIGWRGFALPRLLKHFNPTIASVILGIIWGIFHLPLYWSRPTFAYLFLALAPALSILLTWLFIQSKGSVLLTTLFHASYNTWGQVFMTAQPERALGISIAVSWGFVLLLFARFGFGLSSSPIWVLENADRG